MRRVFLLLLLVACGPRPAAQPRTPSSTVEIIKVTVGTRTVDIWRQNDVSTVEFQATRAQVWTALVAAHEALGIPAAAVDAKAGTAVYVHKDHPLLDGKRVSAYVDCGTTMTGARADTYNVTIKVTEVLDSPRAGTIAVHTVVNAWAKSLGLSSDAVPCNSTEALEKRIAELLIERLK